MDAPVQRPGRARGPPRRALAPQREDAEELAALQVGAGAHAQTLLAPGGELHYAVCTLNPDENEAIAPAAGLMAHDELRTWPDEGDDGFYARAWHAAALRSGRRVRWLSACRCACRRP